MESFRLRDVLTLSIARRVCKILRVWYVVTLTRSPRYIAIALLRYGKQRGGVVTYGMKFIIFYRSR